MIMQDYLRRNAEAAPAPVSRPAVATQAARPAPTDLAVTVAVPAHREPAPVFVDITDPDGRVRTYPLQGGRLAIRVREWIVRPGESWVLHMGNSVTGK